MKEGPVPQHIVDRRRIQRMQEIDALPADIRECIHEYGYTVVRACLDLNVRKARQIRHLVETVLNEFSPTRGSYAAQGPRSRESLEEIAANSGQT